MSNNLLDIIKEIELGPINRKLAAISKLRSIENVSLNSIQPILDKIHAETPAGSPLKFFAAATLAAFGDDRDIIVDTLTLTEMVSFEGEDGGLPYFPWIGERQSYFPKKYEDITIVPKSTLVATAEALSHMRANNRAADILVKFLEILGTGKEKDEFWRPFIIYALGANGNPASRPTLEYYRGKYAKSIEGEAARIALEHFGTKTFFELALLHRNATKTKCFIATAVYGNEDVPEVEIFRRFRDEVLLSYYIGRRLISFYYRFSPYVATLIGRYTFAKSFVKTVFLKPAVWLISHRRNKQKGGE